MAREDAYGRSLGRDANPARRLSAVARRWVSNRSSQTGPTEKVRISLHSRRSSGKLRRTDLRLAICRSNPGKVSDSDAAAFGTALAETAEAHSRLLSHRYAVSTTLWALSEAGHRPMADILKARERRATTCRGVASRIAAGGTIASDAPVDNYDIVIVGGGSAGAAVAASLLARQGNLNIAIIEPADVHYYQPGWTLVGGGVFDARADRETMASVFPRRRHGSRLQSRL